MKEAVVVALIASVAPLAAVIVTLIVANRKLNAIHKIVNSRLTKALRQIETLKDELLGIRNKPEG